MSGLPMSPNDIDRAIRIALERWPEKSNKEIAEHIGTTVGNVRRQRPDPPPEASGLSWLQRYLLCWLWSQRKRAEPHWGVPWRSRVKTASRRVSVSRALARLERRGLVRRHNRHTDGVRTTHVELTEGGQEIAQRLTS